MFGKVKTIVLPGNAEAEKLQFTIEEYKETYGIDLRDFLVLKEMCIRLNPKVVVNTQILVEFGTPLGATVLCPAVEDMISEYQSGEDDASTELSFVTSNGNIGLRFKISKAKPFDISNLEVQVLEF